MMNDNLIYPASKMREIAEEALELNKSKEMKNVMNVVYKAAKSGQFHVHYYKDMLNHTVKELEKMGYTVKFFRNHGSDYYLIKW